MSFFKRLKDKFSGKSEDEIQKELTEDKIKKLTELEYINEVKFADRL